MDKSSVLEIISRFKNVLEGKHIRIQKIILFGSWAQGNPHEWSDIDLIVISEDFRGKDFWARIDILSEAIFDIFEPIEAQALTADEWDLGEDSIVEYAREGEIVYAA